MVQAEENVTRHAQVGVMGYVLQVILLSRFFCYSTSHSEGVLMWEERQQVGGWHHPNLGLPLALFPAV